MNTRELILEMAEYRVAPAGLLDRAKSGDLGAFEQVMRMHEKQVLSTALRLLGNWEDAQDAAQEVFLRLHRSLGRIGEIQEVRAWLYRVTVNLCNDMHRLRRRTQTVAFSGPEPASNAPDPEAAWRNAERRRLVEQALATLPAKERAAVVLRDVEGLSTREVAGILGSSETTVRSQISVARMKLRKFTERYLRKRR